MFTGANSNRKTLWLYHIHNHVTELHSNVPRAYWWGYVRMNDEVGKVLLKWEAKGLSGERASLLSVGTNEVWMGKGWHYPSDTGWVYGTGNNWRPSKQPGNSKGIKRGPPEWVTNGQQRVSPEVSSSKDQGPRGEPATEAAGAVPGTSQAYWKDTSAGQYILAMVLLLEFQELVWIPQ